MLCLPLIGSIFHTQLYHTCPLDGHGEFPAFVDHMTYPVISYLPTQLHLVCSLVPQFLHWAVFVRHLPGCLQC